MTFVINNSKTRLKWTRKVWLNDGVQSVPLALPVAGGPDILGLTPDSRYTISPGPEFTDVENSVFLKRRAFSNLQLRSHIATH